MHLLTDYNQAEEHFLDPQVYHVSILVACLQLIGMNYEGGQHLIYAYQNWCYHFSLGLSHGATVGSMNANCDVVMLIRKMEQQRLWIYGLKDFAGVKAMYTDCESVVAKMAVSLLLWKVWSIY